MSKERFEGMSTREVAVTVLSLPDEEQTALYKSQKTCNHRWYDEASCYAQAGGYHDCVCIKCGALSSGYSPSI